MRTVTSVRAMASVPGERIIIFRVKRKHQLIAKIILNLANLFLMGVIVGIVERNNRSRLGSVSACNCSN